MDTNIDKSNLRQVILDFFDQFETGFEIAKNTKLDGKFYKLSVSGMGGSALPADLFRIFANDLVRDSESSYFDINVNRDYSIPVESLGTNTLHIVASYSGNTEETISCLEELKKNNFLFIGLASGGKIEELCKKYNAPFVKLPVPNPQFQPRMGVGYFFAVLYQICINHGLLPDKKNEILSSAEKLKKETNDLEASGKALAENLKGRTPVIYASSQYKHVAMVWKIKINENSKTPSFWNFFPELNHNEMVGFTNPQGKFITIMLRDPMDHKRNRKRYEAIQKILEKNDVESKIIEMSGNSVFEKIFASIALSDWTSYYLALIYGQDPTPVDMVEEFKKIIAS